MTEYRSSRRVPFREALGIEEGRYEEFKGAVACDLSEGGVRIRSEKFMSLGTPLRARFQLEDKQVVTLTGKVAWVQKEPYGEYYQIGVEFQQEEDALFKRRNIHDYIEENH